MVMMVVMMVMMVMMMVVIALTFNFCVRTIFDKYMMFHEK